MFGAGWCIAFKTRSGMIDGPGVRKRSRPEDKDSDGMAETPEETAVPGIRSYSPDRIGNWTKNRIAMIPPDPL
jgi:hypothetical protein